MKEEELYYVSVTGADELRREILTSSRNVLEIMKNYERFKSANLTRLHETEKLKVKVREIYRLINKLKSSLPPIKVPKAKKAREQAVKRDDRGDAALDSLEAELHEIDRKLNSLV